MTEPLVSYPLRVVLDRIEADLRAMREDVAALKTSAAVTSAVGRARVALWTAGVSAVTAGSALALVVFSRR